MTLRTRVHGHWTRDTRPYKGRVLSCPTPKDLAGLSSFGASARQTAEANRIGFIDRGADLDEIKTAPQVGQFRASSAPMANPWQYTASGAA